MHWVEMGLAFLEGFLLILSPCVLPILPVVLSVGSVGGQFRPYGVMTGFILAFCAFTLLARHLVSSLGLDVEWLRRISYGMIFLMGLALLVPKVGEWFAGWTQPLADWGNRLGMKTAQSDGFWSGLGSGLAIGLIWTPCAGPIFAAVVVQVIRQGNNLNSLLTLLSFTLGVGLPMLLITLQGRKLLGTLPFLKARAARIRQVLGGVLILSVILASQQMFLAGLWARTPALQTEAPAVSSALLINPLPSPYPAPSLEGIAGWVNLPPGQKSLTLSALKGKVVLVDFWTYSCINCIRTLPHLTAWDARYRDQGLVIVGVHTPEFEFEKKLSNVEQAVREHGIHYPVALDNDYQTWSSFSNQYWPAHYLIDRSGRVVYTHSGEGEYDATENNIRYLLGLKDSLASLPKPEEEPSVFQLASDMTPETYLGFKRTRNFSSPQGLVRERSVDFAFPKILPLHAWALSGLWQIQPERVVAEETGASLRLAFQARKVFLVLGSASGKPVSVTVLLNGQPVEARGGKDVHNSVLTVKGHALYELVNLPAFGQGLLELQTQDPGLEAYAFTFGG